MPLRWTRDRDLGTSMQQHSVRNETMPSCCAKANEAMRTSALQWPWILLNVSLYAFAIPWMLSAIINQYFISKDYDSTLPGLDDTAARIFFIGAHMGLGLICLLLYPLQFFGCIRKRFPVFHRWSGRISLAAAVFASLCGMVFICMKDFTLWVVLIWALPSLPTV